MTTIDRATLEIQPGEQATVYVPIPFGAGVSKVDVDLRTAASFKILRADLIGPSSMLAETGTRAPAVRLLIENVSPSPKRARIFVDIDRDVAAVGRELGSVAERFNREVFELRRKRGAN
jgi:hypothetical protein